MSTPAEADEAAPFSEDDLEAQESWERAKWQDSPDPFDGPPAGDNPWRESGSMYKKYGPKKEPEPKIDPRTNLPVAPETDYVIARFDGEVPMEKQFPAPDHVLRALRIPPPPPPEPTMDFQQAMKCERFKRRRVLARSKWARKKAKGNSSLHAAYLACLYREDTVQVLGDLETSIERVADGFRDVPVAGDPADSSDMSSLAEVVGDALDRIRDELVRQ